MRQIFDMNYISEEEKQNILSKHRTIYDGYQVMDNKVNNTQPLYMQDFRGDKEGMILNNKGEIKKNKNFGINEQFDFDDDLSDSQKLKSTEFDGYDDEEEDSELEGEVEVEMKPSDFSKRYRNVDLGKSFEKFKSMGLDESEKGMCSECGSPLMEGECMECGRSGMYEEWNESKEVCSECGSPLMEGECMECGFKGMYEEMGDLDDIYDVSDLDPDAEFDYVRGSKNKENTFKSMHRDMYEQGGNADDIDVSDVEPAYNFVSGGPDNGGDAYPVNEENYIYEPMESAWADDDLEEQDLSGAQGIYADMEPAYDFISGGAGKAGPYQRRYEGEEKDLEEMFYDTNDWDNQDLRPKSFKDYESQDEFDVEDDVQSSLLSKLRKTDPKDIEDIEWEEIDSDIKESFLLQKNKINEMFDRMNRYN